jgi:hypothetical protein
MYIYFLTLIGGGEFMPRVNINVSQELYEWYLERSKAIGTSMSGLMGTALYDYYESRQPYSSYEADTMRRKDQMNNLPRGTQRSTKRNSREFTCNE